MRVMVLVPTVPQTLKSEVPWHFFQELQPLAKRGVQLCVVSSVKPDYKLDGIEFHQIGIRSLKRHPWQVAKIIRFATKHCAVLPPVRLHEIGKLQRLVQWNLSVLEVARRWPPDIIHCHWAYPANSGGVLAAREMRIPLVMTLRGIEHQTVPEFHYGCCLDSFYEQALTKAMMYASKITVCCQDSVERIQDLGITDSGKIERIFHAVDASRLAGNTETDHALANKIGVTGKRVIICIARMEDGGRKGHQTLLNAFRLVHEKYRDTSLLLVGDGRDRNGLVGMADDLGIRENVLFFGRAHPNIIGSLLRISTCSVLPSFSEAFANVVFESLVAGTPVVSSAVAAPKDVLPLGPYGQLFLPGDVEGLASAVGRVLDNPITAKEMTLLGGQFVRREMSIENRVGGFLRVYEQVSGIQYDENSNGIG